MAKKIEGCSKNILPYFWGVLFLAFVVFYWAYYTMSNRNEDRYEMSNPRQKAIQQNRQDIQQGNNMGMVVAGENPSPFASIIPQIREGVVNISVMNSLPALQRRAADQTPALKDKQTQEQEQGGLAFVDPFTGPEYESIGSGIIIEPSGYILTNYHVVENAKTVFVTTFIGDAQQRYQAQVINTDALRDLAVVQIITRKELPVAILGDSNKVNIGDVVIAVGSPWGLSQSVTSGIISAKRQSITIEGVTHANLIQTDASINQGNSGGPLINANGEVIGINTAIYTPNGAFSGVGFAVPSNQAKEFIEDTIDIELPADNMAQQVLFGFGTAPPIQMGIGAPHPNWGECTNCHVYINSPAKPGTSQPAAFGLNIATQTNQPDFFNNLDKPYIGLDIQKIDNIISRQFNIDTNKGVMINFIAENSPAMNAGLQIGDVIIKLNGRWVDTPFTFNGILNAEPVGETVRIAFLRNGRRSETYLTTEPMPGNLNNIFPQNRPLSRPPEEIEWMGLEMKLLTANIARKRKLPINEKGLYVTEAGGIAGASGIAPGDIITSINRMPISDFASFNEAIKRVNLNDGIVLQVNRMGRNSFVVIQ